MVKMSCEQLLTYGWITGTALGILIGYAIGRFVEKLERR